MIGVFDRLGHLRAAVAPERRVVLAAVLIAAVVFLPLAVFSVLVGQTVGRDVAARSAEDRVRTAELGATVVDVRLREAVGAVAAVSLRQLLPVSLIERDVAELERHANDLLGSARFASVAVFDPRGTLLARVPASPGIIGEDFSHRDYFAGAIRSTDAYISEAFTSAATGEAIVAVSRAIRDGGQTVGVIIGTLPLSDLVALLRPLDVVEGRHVLLFDRGARLIGASGMDLALLAAYDPPGIDRALAGEVGTRPWHVEGVERVVTFAPVAMADWALFVVDDAALALIAERRLARELTAGAAVIGLVGLALVVALTVLYRRTLRQADQVAAAHAATVRLNEDLARANSHKSKFLASMSHELRTPLNAILGFSDLLAEPASSLGDRQRRYLRNISDAGNHLLELINDILDLAKIEAGRTELRRETIALEALVAPVAASTRDAAEARSQRFTVELPPALVMRVDPGRTRQILYNLLSNAVKFTPPGGAIDLRVTAEGDALVLEVSDTGIGIPAEHRDRAFGTFERLHEGRSDASGTGLGLAVTKQLVELYGGTISFESLEGGGTTFRVLLPGVLQGEIAADRVLIVEDEARDAELVAALAASVGLHTEIVGTAAYAGTAARRNRPLGVVLDLRLPDERGEAVLRELRAMPGPRIPVIVVSIEDDEGVARGLGADDHLTKPIDHARLLGWLRQLAARRTAERAREGISAPAAG